MQQISRVLDVAPVLTLDDYVRNGGGRALDTVRAWSPEAIIECVRAAGIRGRGGAGFPTAIKWDTVARNASPFEPTTVVVNAAEGEPGSFKDRELLRRNPYRTLEGALIAALAVGAPKVIVGMKDRAGPDIARVEAAARECRTGGWFEDIEFAVVHGPSEYLFGEETALCEVIDGRHPLPRVAPPYRRGVDEVVEHADDIGTGSGLPAHVEMAAPEQLSFAPPTLVDNVETLAHVALACANGADWFRAIGTDASPGSFVCTVSGATMIDAVGEFPMGTTLRTVLEELGGGLRPGRSVRAVLQGVSAAVLSADQLDTPLSWEAMDAIGSGLGASAFIVFDDTTDPVAVAAGASRFLAVESCGQCDACKQDGLAISDALERILADTAKPDDVDTVRTRLVTVADGARCSLATQHQVVVGSLLAQWPAEFEHRAREKHAHIPIANVLPFHDLRDGVATIDVDEATKQPDWTHDAVWSGQSPADRFSEHRSAEQR